MPDARALALICALALTAAVRADAAAPAAERAPADTVVAMRQMSAETDRAKLPVAAPLPANTPVSPQSSESSDEPRLLVLAVVALLGLLASRRTGTD